jgi:hypothetical protein
LIHSTVHKYANLALIPIGGIAVFVSMYILAAMVYPGGSYANTNGEGFSILNNYWCELMDPYAKNGQWNPARPIAVSAMAILCLSLTFFWYFLPLAFSAPVFRRFLVQYAGIASMLIAPFVFTNSHDAVVMSAGVFGSVAFTAALVELYLNGAAPLFRLGVVALAMVLICYYIFRTELFVDALPLLQKFAFILCLTWFGWTSRYVHLRLYQAT